MYCCRVLTSAALESDPSSNICWVYWDMQCLLSPYLGKLSTSYCQGGQTIVVIIPRNETQ